MLRLHVTDADLGRIRLGSTPNAPIELSLSLSALRQASVPAGQATWRAGLNGRLSSNTRLLFDLMPMCDIAPDFLDPGPDCADRATAVATVAGTPRQVVNTYLNDLAWHTGDRLTAPTRRFHDADMALMTRLGEAVRDYHDVALGPHWQRLRGLIDVDRASRARVLADGGLDALLSTVHPHIRWRHPCLEINLRTTEGTTLDLRLRGRGLVLQPSYFVRSPMVDGADVDTDDDRHPIVLLYPVATAAPLMAATPRSDPRPGGAATAADTDRPLPSLTALMGGTRAAILSTLATGATLTTTELARSVMTSPATASEHATVLRAAGLVTTTRHGRQVLHTITTLGRALVPAVGARPVGSHPVGTSRSGGH